MVGESYSWEEGMYTNDTLWWTCCSNANYTAGTNTVTTQMSLTTAGKLTAT